MNFFHSGLGCCSHMNIKLDHSDQSCFTNELFFVINVSIANRSFASFDTKELFASAALIMSFLITSFAFHLVKPIISPHRRV